MNNSMRVFGIQKLKNKLQEVLRDDITGAQLYLLALIIFLCGETLTTTMFQVPGRVYLACKVLPVLLVIVKILLFDRYSVRAFWLTAFAVVTGGMIAVSSGYLEPVLWLIMLIGARNVPWKKILQVYVIVVASIVFLAFCASLLEVIENLQYSVEGSGLVRNSFGSIYTTDFASHIFYVFLAVFYLMKDRLRIWHYSIAAVIAILVFRFCNTRLDVGCIFMLIAAFIIVNLWQKKRTVAKKYNSHDWFTGKLTWFMPFTMIIMALATILYSPDRSLFAKLDAILSTRLQLGKAGLVRYGLSLFGQQVEMVGNGGSTTQLKDYFFVDCSYLYVLLRYGLIFLLIVLCVYILCCKKFKDDPYFLAAIALVSINCMIAHHLIELTYNPFALALFASVPGLTETEKNKGRKILLWLR